MCYSTTMFDRIKALFESAENSDNQEMASSDELQLAAASLLVEAASVGRALQEMNKYSDH